MTTFHAYLDDQDLIQIEGRDLSLPFYLETANENLPLEPVKTSPHAEEVSHYFLSPIPLQLGEEYFICDAKGKRTLLHYRDIVRKPLFDQTFTYEEEDLGTTYTPQKTLFKFWAPISQEVTLVLNGEHHAMTRTEKGVWEIELSGDWEGASYHYAFRVNGISRTIHDPYALSSLANSGDSLVIDRKKITRPIKRAKTQLPPTQAIIYELSVRDFSAQAKAGFKHPGKFSALTESPQMEGQVFGFDYLQDLGVTHVQLLPVYDFGSVDEENQFLHYNWGYDPVQYNVPEGSYASDSNDPYARILELQAVIDAYHEKDLSLIMDVVYNHVYKADEFAFEQIVPGYFYRYDQDRKRTNGTFCGNDVASERAMVRRYIKQSLKQWIQLYGFDGFRFDLMGILDSETMTEIAEELRQLYPNIYLYGEGWKMETGLPAERLAHQYQAKELPAYGFFSDNFRDGVKKSLLNGKKIQAKYTASEFANLLTANVGLVGTAHFLQPHQAINYVECHDNATVYDFFKVENPQLKENQRKAMSRLALHLVLLSQGVPFIHAGQEFYRSKNLEDNTYNLPDQINQFDWTSIRNSKKEVQFVKELIAYRKQEPLLRLEKAQDIRDYCDFQWLSPHHFSYSIEKNHEKLVILVNISSQPVPHEIPESSQVLLKSSFTSHPDQQIPAFSWILYKKQV